MEKRNYHAKLIAYDMDNPKQVKNIAKWLINEGKSILKELKEMSDGKESGFAKRFTARLMK